MSPSLALGAGTYNGNGPKPVVEPAAHLSLNLINMRQGRKERKVSGLSVLSSAFLLSGRDIEIILDTNVIQMFSVILILETKEKTFKR